MERVFIALLVLTSIGFALTVILDETPTGENAASVESSQFVTEN